MKPSEAAEKRAVRSAGLGILGLLDDLTLLRICSFAGPSTLARMCSTSKTLTAFASLEEFWQAACLSRYVKSTREFTDIREPLAGFYGTWKASYCNAARLTAGIPIEKRKKTAVSEADHFLYSDTLYLPHQRTYGPSVFGLLPKGPRCVKLSKDALPDVPGFVSRFESGSGRPVVLENIGANEAAAHTWDEASLRKQLGDRVFHAGGVNFRLQDYFEYAHLNTDDQPLYLFDPTFTHTAPELLAAYTVPSFFQDDLFSLLDARSRPDYRWLLIGGSRSGQSWHKDPNGTSAWNLTIRGRKRWFFFPPTVTPPGVVVSEVTGETVTPISLAEWGMNFYEEACTTTGFLEAETGRGDVMFVPRGWWHMVLNVDPLTIAVSHHFLSPSGLSNTLRLLRQAPEEVSGVDRGLVARDKSGGGGSTQEELDAQDQERRRAAGQALHDCLVDALQEHRPEALSQAEEELRREKSTLKALISTAAPQPFAFNFEEQ